MIDPKGEPVILKIQLDQVTARKLENICLDSGLMRHEVITLLIRALSDANLIHKLAELNRLQKKPGIN